MDELTDVIELAGLDRMRADLPGPSPRALTAARTALLERMTEPAVLHPTVEHSPVYRPHRPRRVLVRRAAFGLTVTAAIAATVFALTAGPTDPQLPAAQPTITALPPSPPTNPSGGAPSSARAAEPPPAVVHYANAAQVLDTAAARARASATLAAGQYGHVRTHTLHVTQTDGATADSTVYLVVEDRDDVWNPAGPSDPGYWRAEDAISVHHANAKQGRYIETHANPISGHDVTWSSVDEYGNARLITPPGAPVHAACSACAPTTNPFDLPSRANLARLTTDPGKLRRELFTWAQAQHADAAKYGKATYVNSIALKTINDIIAGSSATASLRARLFQIAKTIPGIKITGSLANYDEVRGTGIGLTDPWGVTQSLIFSSTGEYLGEKDVVTRRTLEYELKPGTVIAWTSYSFDVTGKPKVPTGR